jgi:hypothetical protein
VHSKDFLPKWVEGKMDCGCGVGNLNHFVIEEGSRSIAIGQV